MLGDSRENMHRQPVRHRHVGRGELDAAFHQGRDERDIARQPVQLGDDQRRAGGLRMRQRGE